MKKILAILILGLLFASCSDSVEEEKPAAAIHTQENINISED